MNISYFRKSSVSKKETIANVKKQADKLGLTLIGETMLPNNKGIVFHIANPTWIGNLVASDVNLLGLLPSMVTVLEKDNEVTVGVGSPSVLGSISRNPAVAQLAQEAEETLKKLINESAEVGPLKPKEIKLYSTTTCPYCKMEAAWLDDKKVKYQEVHVDLNEKEAEAMVQKTGQMGVPVTEIQYDNGEEEYIVGFNKPQLSQILGI